MFGKNLRKARKKRNLTLINAALTLNTTHATLSRYENEKLEPNIEMLKQMCLLYNVSADYLIGLPENMPFPKA